MSLSGTNKNRVFDRVESPGKLLLTKRRTAALPSLGVFAAMSALWVSGWFASYQVDAVSGVWPVLIFLFPLLLSIPFLLDQAATLKGVSWQIDCDQNRIERNGVLVGHLDQMECVQVEERSGLIEGTFNSTLSLIPHEKEPLVLATTSDAAQLVEIAHLISRCTSLPVRLEGLEPRE